MSNFELILGRKLRTNFDISVPHAGDTELSEGLDAFIGQHKQVLRKVRQDLEERHHDNAAVWQKVNAHITRPSADGLIQPGGLVLVRDCTSNIHKHNDKGCSIMINGRDSGFYRRSYSELRV